MSIASESARRIPPSTLQTRLRESREWRGLDQTVLADALDVKRTTISNYERGVTTPSRLQVNAWAVVCDVDVEWLKTGSETPDDDNPVGPTGIEPMTSTVESHRLARVTSIFEKLAS